MYVTAEDKSTFEKPFDISTIPVVTKEQADAEDRTRKLTTITPVKAPKVTSTKDTVHDGEFQNDSDSHREAVSRKVACG